MARFNFRHGIARRQEDGFGNGANLQPSNGGSFIDLIVSPDPTIFIIAHYDVDYMVVENASKSKAWGPFISSQNYWLYWDIDFLTGELTRGFTTFEPVHGLVPPHNPQVDMHWFDNNEMVMKVWSGSQWIEKIRVFACKYQNGTTIIDVPIGSQIGVNGIEVFAGNILFDPDGRPLQKFQRNRRGRFITTETELHSQFSRISNFRVEASIVQGRATENIPIHHCISYNGYDELVLSRNTISSRPCIGLSSEDMETGEVRSYITKGFITNEVDWDWSDFDVGTPLFVGETGELVTEPPINNFIQQVAIIINQTTIYVNIGTALYTGGVGNLIPIQIDRNTGKWFASKKGTSSPCGEIPQGVRCAWGYFFEQQTESDSWIITHNLDTRQIITDVYDSNGYKIIPDEIRIVDENTVEVTLSTPSQGTLHVIGLINQE